MKKTLFFDEIVTYRHSVKLKADSEELLDNALKDTYNSIVSGGIREKEEIFKRFSDKGIECTFNEDVSPDVEITCI